MTANEAFQLMMKMWGFENKPYHEQLIINSLVQDTYSLVTIGQDRNIGDMITNAHLEKEISPELLIDIGALLLRWKNPVYARYFFEKAHYFNKSSLEIERTFFGFKENVVDRWHFKMLNDRRRNEAYKMAIRNKIRTNVIDVGTGTGLLSIYAAQCPECVNITALEENSVLADLANSALGLEEHMDKAIVLPINSLQYQPTIKADLLVTEIFDTALFGEWAIPTLIHAWEHLLHENADVIPCRAVIKMTGIQSYELLKKQMLLNTPHLFDKFPNEIICNNSTEPYDAEYLPNRKDVIYMTNTHCINVNFRNKNELKRFHDNLNKAIEEFDYNVLENGEIHAFAIWFDLYLTEEICITTNPCDPNRVTCWEQAVIYLKKPLSVKKNDTVAVSCYCRLSKISCVVKNENSERINTIKLKDINVAYINDEIICKTVKEVTQALSRKISSEELQPDSEIVIVDFSKTPILGLNIAKETNEFEVFINCPSPEDRQFTKKLCEVNNINFNKLTFCSSNLFEELVNYEPIFDAIIFDPISQNGQLNEEELRSCLVYKENIKRTGCLLPSSVSLQFCIIESQYLDDITRVKEENLLGAESVDIINYYRVPDLSNLDKADLTYTQLSPVITGHDIIKAAIEVNQEFCQTHPCLIIKPGKAIGVLYWFTLNYVDNISVNTSETSYYNLAANLFKEEIEVKPGCELSIVVRQVNGYLRINEATI